MVHDAGSLVGDGSGGLWGSVAGPPVGTAPAAQTEFLGLGHTHGRIAPGYAADLALLDDAIAVQATWIAGDMERHAA